MQDVSDISHIRLFIAYAQEKPIRWKLVLGHQVTHTKFGVGTIKSVGSARLIVCFVDDQQTSRTFTSESLANTQFFSHVHLPTNLEGIETTKERLQAELHLEVQKQLKVQNTLERIAGEKLERQRQQVQKRLETEKRIAEEKLERQRQQVQKRLEAEKRIAEEKLERQRLEEQRKREQIASAEFSSLKIKYCAQSCSITALSNPLYLILLRIDAGEVLQDNQITWLENNRLFSTLAIYFQNEYQKTKNPWKLIKASAHLRSAKNPNKAIELTNYLLENYGSASLQVKSAILTTRGGAFRDLQDLSTAELCAIDAIKENESFQPYNLLGAICFERGEPKQGEAYFLRALELGAQSKVQEAQMQSALKNAGQSEQRVVAQFLLQRDPVRYQWAAYYLEQKRILTSE